MQSNRPAAFWGNEASGDYCLDVCRMIPGYPPKWCFHISQQNQNRDMSFS